ncbi:MAG: hypothetical protein ACR2L0_06605 [Gaiellaceae bacterium]
MARASAVEPRQVTHAGSQAIDYDLHGLAGVRLVDATPADAAAVSLQLGPIRASLDREPDIVVRFVDRLPTTRLRYLGAGEAAFTDDAFLVLRSKHKVPARVSIPFAEIGDRCEIVCERGLPAVPLLIPILNLTVLARGALPLHASAFVYGETGVVATGWSKGGKTETLLAFMQRGAEYVGDEWVYVSSDGDRIFGIPEPIRLWDWHLSQLPDYRALVGRGDRGRLRALRLALALEGALDSGASSRVPLARGLGRALPVLKRQLHVDVEPARLFGERAIAVSAAFDRLFFVVSTESKEITVEPIDPREVARRMSFSLAYERLGLAAYYAMFRFAFPGAASPVLDQAGELEQQALSRLLADKPANVVYHPCPMSIAALFDAMRPYCTPRVGDDVDHR